MNIRRFLLTMVASFAAVLVSVPFATAAPVNTSPPTMFPGAIPQVGMSEGYGGQCKAELWTPGGQNLQFLYEWVIDPTSPTPPIVGSSGWTTSNMNVFNPTGPLVNHVLACQVTARDDSGTGATILASVSTEKVKPSVDLTLNGRTISGDVGGGLSGTDSVVVTLRRDSSDGLQRVIESTPAATIAANGTWSATLPTHGVADNRDTLYFDFTGDATVAGDETSSGVPPDTTLPFNGGANDAEQFDRRDGALSAFRPMLTGGGTGIDIFAPYVRSGHATVTVHAPFALGGDIALDSTSRNWGEPGDPFRTTFTGTATNNDLITIDGKGFIAPLDSFLPVRLGVTKDVGMLNSIDDNALRGEDEGRPVDPTLAPYCYALLFYLEGPGVICRNLDPSVGYTVTHKRGVVTVETAGIDPGSREAALTDLVPGDVLELRQAGIGGPRLLTSVTVRALQAHIDWDGITVTCAPGYWIGLTMDVLCDDGSITIDPDWLNEIPRTSDFEDDFPPMVTLEDDLSGGGTAVMVPNIWTTVPGNGDSVWGSSWTARASTTNDAFMFGGAQGATVTLFVRPYVSPVNFGPWTQVPGNVDTAGVTVSNLAAGIYDARWHIADSNGDTRDVTTWFVQQAAVTGPQGPQGPEGAAGPGGAAGPAGSQSPPVRDALVKCTVRKYRTRFRVTCKVSKLAATSRSVTLSLARVSLGRGGRTLAAGSAKVRGGAATIRMMVRKRLPARSYRVTLVEYENPVNATASTQVIKLGR